MTWVPAQDGHTIDLWHPRPEDVDPEELACLLSRLKRFGGRTRRDLPPYTVAQHSVFVCDLLPPELKLAGLLHDAHEACLGFDMTSPVKSMLASHRLEILERRWDWAVAKRFGFDPQLMLHDAVKHADLVALATEKRDLLVPSEREWRTLPEPHPVLIDRVMSEEDAAACWLHTLSLVLWDPADEVLNETLVIARAGAEYA